MIFLHPKLLSDPKAKGISEWLRDPRARDYFEYLMAKAAEKAAEAGNGLTDGSNNAVVDAKEHAKEAKRYTEMVSTMQAHAAHDFNFPIVELKSTPPIK
jgi:nucleoside phosphorylase